jgi:putative Ca2+/H+ antiporter (TMEM165/GDT1 family)
VTGVCPAVAFVQLGEGKALALMTIAGVVLGNYLYSVVHERWFRWPTSGCADD